jgi:dolichyl-phosphate beta-glucosyltransferase
MDLSIVIPAYNESKKIGQDLETTLAYLTRNPRRSTEVLVVDDGSQDGTREVVAHFIRQHASRNPVFRLLDYGKNRGKGFAVKHGVAEACGDAILFMDAGMCVPLKYIESGLRCLNEGYDFAIASRKLPGTKITRRQPLYRRWGSKVFGSVIRNLMGISVTDTQCGFKFYKNEAAKKIFSRVTIDGFMFDIEALILAEELGFKVAEFPVEWANDGDTRYSPVLGTVRNFRELTAIRVKSLARRVKVARGFGQT